MTLKNVTGIQSTANATISRAGTGVGPRLHAVPAHARKTSGTRECRVVHATSGRNSSGAARNPEISIARESAATAAMTIVRLMIRPLRPGAITARRGA